MLILVVFTRKFVWTLVVNYLIMLILLNYKMIEMGVTFNCHVNKVGLGRLPKYFKLGCWRS